MTCIAMCVSPPPGGKHKPEQLPESTSAGCFLKGGCPRLDPTAKAPLPGRNTMLGKLIGAALPLTFTLALWNVPALAGDYFPPKGANWATHTPEQEGFDPARLKQAIDFAIAAESKYAPALAKVADVRDLRTAVPMKYAGEAFSSPIGPLKARAPANGIIIRHGYIVAEWGQTKDVDMTF